MSDTDTEWSYANRDCPRCDSDNTWTNMDDFRCESCGRTTESGGFSRNESTGTEPLAEMSTDQKGGEM